MKRPAKNGELLNSPKAKGNFTTGIFGKNEIRWSSAQDTPECSERKEPGSMTREEANRYIGALSNEEIIRLDALISSLEQRHQPAQNPPVKAGKAE